MKKNKLIRTIIAVALSVACIMQMTCSSFAATRLGKSYVSEVILSYGETEDEAKQWLKDKGYKVLDNNLNEGADDTFSTKRAVYLGYKTTNKTEEAITDLKLMNMTGGYSTMDYQLLLEQEKSDIRAFIADFVTAINEYRDNYAKEQSRAVAAHDMLNLLYDDDTEETLGDLFLEKIKEEYTDAEFAALSEEEQKKHADLTTILMQGNATSILVIEQIIAIATDASDNLWTDRYASQPSYDDMVDELMDSENLTVSQAMMKLASMYDSDAELIASKIDAYREFLATYTDADVSLDGSTAEQLAAYQEKEGSANTSAWITAGAQYKLLETLVNSDGDSLLDIITSEEYDIADDAENRYMLYPLVASLTEGQRACLDFLPLYQIVALGINGDDATKTAMEAFNLNKDGYGPVSVYAGIDRSIFSSDVALTGNAYMLQSSSGKEVTGDWFDNGLSESTKVLFIAFGVSVVTTVVAFSFSKIFNTAAVETSRAFVEGSQNKFIEEAVAAVEEEVDLVDNVSESALEESFNESGNETFLELQSKTMASVGAARTMSNVFRYVGYGLTAVSIIIMGISLWNAYKDLKAYYNTELTPIPGYMVDEAVNENGEKVYTYYKAALSNREESQFTTDRTKLLGAYGDINGDVGKEWVALYSTKDKTAGNPITSEFIVQYADTNIPGDDTPLSIFCESTAQNLTNYKAGYTYADSKNGIYLFYSTDSTAYAGSAITGGTYALIGVGCFVVFGLAAFFIKRSVKKGKEKKDA